MVTGTLVEEQELSSTTRSSARAKGACARGGVCFQQPLLMLLGWLSGNVAAAACATLVISNTYPLD
jgi:hypothetical protein